MEWSLPGPARFIRRVIDKLEDRKNLIFMLPEDFDINLLCQTLKKAVRENSQDMWWEERSILDLINNHHTQPGEAITRAFDLQDEEDPGAIHDAGFVARFDDLSDWVIFLEDLNELDEAGRLSWMNFLADYADACKERENRSIIFCVPLLGKLAFEDPPDDVLLEHLWWWGIVSRWDVMQYLHLASPVTTLENTWKNAIIAELAGWDFDLVDKLIQFDDQNFANIDNILSCLLDYANEKGWDAITLRNLNQIALAQDHNYKPDTFASDFWAKGVLNLMPSEDCNEHPILHPAVLVAKREPKATLKQVIRKGQSRSVLLSIEDQRVAVCEYLRARHGNNWHNWCEGGYNNGHYEIGEIGHLDYLFKNASHLPRYDRDLDAIRELLDWMRSTRNDLSHLKPLDFDELQTGVRLIEQARPYLRRHVTK